MTLSYSAGSTDAPNYHAYSDMITPLGNFNGIGKLLPKEGPSKDKKEYVEGLVSYPTRNEQHLCLNGHQTFEKTLYQLPLEILIKLNSHLVPIFNDTFSNDLRKDMVTSLLSIDPNEWETVGKQTDFIIANRRSGHDIAFATNILSMKTSELRGLIVKISNSLFDWEDDSRIRVRILAAVSKLSKNELLALKEDEEKTAKLLQEVKSDFNVELGLTNASLIHQLQNRMENENL